MSMDESSDFRWRQGWLSLGLPPSPVLAITGIIAFFLYLSWGSDYEEHMRRRAEAGLSVLLVLAVLALAVLALYALTDGDGRVVVPVLWPDGGADGGAGASPWGVAAVVALLLVMASHKSSFQLFRPPWY